ncbi:hypothetical protein [Natronocalculus amylovorans]|uniref:Uncharacterized protein n=1 Tax=Natronocalculus amylovorans TaxID=2917812 RepID=A0AAE3G009_9EURY|nr:hypothetical protein [Natronocalculus amylovorans]MCL9817744.1 hypothetical protein [Natronocalculus amylovorans]
MSRQPSISGIDRSPIGSTTSSRRHFLGITVAVGSATLAGCTSAIDLLAGLVLDDVNLFNATDRTLSGEITITDPNGTAVLTESFEVDPEGEDDEDADGDSGATFGDVFNTDGVYRIALELDEDSALDGTTATAQEVSITDTEDEHIVVVLGTEETDTPVNSFVIEEFSEMQDQLNTD